MPRFELDVRVRIGDGEWLSPVTAVGAGDSADEVTHEVAEALRGIATALDTLPRAVPDGG
ncbi:hypothetical protein [Actinomadura opuntiae]|uniref:hypothetical protein n=1 Tax=Actinomadura sp. OS1-43 TaxID=604315 RepID=UPI00255AD1B6|nr:hypothetical protein [Actinomadura sp. OS1-43]MDL4812813.1 hypothetical protein [Actinomadura sp. OS1-43]